MGFREKKNKNIRGAQLVVERDKLSVDPPIALRRFISLNDLERDWPGQGFMLWNERGHKGEAGNQG